MQVACAVEAQTYALLWPDWQLSVADGSEAFVVYRGDERRPKAVLRVDVGSEEESV